MADFFNSPHLSNYFIDIYFGFIHVTEVIFLKTLSKAPNRPDSTLKTLFTKEILETYVIFSTLQEISIKI